ncbi:MAG TPA: iron-sulfur cluster assembly scaffold protein [Fimbriimonadaceae bacterium]
MLNAATFLNSPENRGEFPGFTSMGESGEPGNGPFAQMWIRVEGDEIKQCHYATHGCIWSIACAGACAQLATGRTMNKARLIEPHDIELILGGIPDGKGDCANKAVKALRSAIGEI